MVTVTIRGPLANGSLVYLCCSLMRTELSLDVIMEYLGKKKNSASMEKALYCIFT